MRLITPRAQRSRPTHHHGCATATPHAARPAAKSITTSPSARVSTRLSALVLVLVLVAVLVLVELVVAAAPAAQAATVEVVVALAGSVDELLTNVRNWLMGILAGLATVFLSIGGVRYVMGGGDPGEIEKAKAAFRSAGFGYALAALAPLVVTVLKGIVGA